MLSFQNREPVIETRNGRGRMMNQRSLQKSERDGLQCESSVSAYNAQPKLDSIDSYLNTFVVF